ncbi:MAG TPA: helix-turn-helix transcriptional regulator [Candidatus Dormibacteraeota bacterium]
MEEKETLGQRIKRIRQDRGMSLKSVVGDDFSRAFLNQVELGKARPSIRVLRIIAERLGTEVEYLLGGREAGVERELALEKGRVLLLQGDSKRALLALRPAINAYDWPLGSDARVAQAQALIALGRKDEAAPIMARERSTIELHNDHHRRERLRTVERGEQFRFTGDTVDMHLRLADRAERAGNDHDELEHYRAARVLLEAGTPKVPTGT